MKKNISIGQVIASILVIIFGLSCCLRGLFAGQFFVAICFAVAAYVCGYEFLFRSSVAELRKSYAKKSSR